MSILQIKSLDEFKKVLEEKKNNTVVFKMYTPWCSKCKYLESRLRDAKLPCSIYKINIDTEPFVDDEQFEIVSDLPCVWIYHNGVRRIVTGSDFAKIVKNIERR